jgi:hypothetical protein
VRRHDAAFDIPKSEGSGTTLLYIAPNPPIPTLFMKYPYLIGNDNNGGVVHVQL